METTEETTAMLLNEQFGSPISEELSNLLTKYTNRDDWADVSRSKGVGSSTIRDVVYRRNSLTESNSKAIIELIRVAIQNIESLIEGAKTASVYAKSITKDHGNHSNT
jgi:cyanate lyase